MINRINDRLIYAYDLAFEAVEKILQAELREKIDRYSVAITTDTVHHEKLAVITKLLGIITRNQRELIDERESGVWQQWEF